MRQYSRLTADTLCCFTPGRRTRLQQEQFMHNDLVWVTACDSDERSSVSLLDKKLAATRTHHVASLPGRRLY